jgi:hypothetical protein
LALFPQILSGATDLTDVCSIIANPPEFIGRRVKIVATAHLTEEYMFIDGSACRKAFQTGDHEWPKAIHVKFSTREAFEASKRLKLSTRGGEFQGIIRAKKKYIFGNHESGASAALGFGHLGMFAVEIVVKKLNDIR